MFYNFLLLLPAHRVVKNQVEGSIFVVKYLGQSLKMHYSPETETIGDVQRMAASYFGLPQKMVFLMDAQEKGAILMHELSIRDVFFPLRTARLNKTALPTLYMVL